MLKEFWYRAKFFILSLQKFNFKIPPRPTHSKVTLTELHVLPDDVELLLGPVLLALDAELPEPATVEVNPLTDDPRQEDELDPEDVVHLRFGVAALDVHFVFDYLQSRRQDQFGSQKETSSSPVRINLGHLV